MSQELIRPKPRVWTVFLATAVALLLSITAQAAVAGLLAMRLMTTGIEPQEVGGQIVAQMMTPPVFIGLMIVSQLMVALTALIFAQRSPIRLRQRVGWLAARCPTWGYAVFMLGSVLPLSLSVGAAHLVAQFVEPDKSTELLYEQMTTAWAIPFIVLIGLLPGLAEELLFRGYVQRRLIDRWGVWVGILVTSAIFAFCHITPHGIALAFVLGIWLGVLAWRTGSILPGVFCHAFVNSGWNVWQVGQYLWGMPAQLPVWAITAGGLLMVVFFAVSIWLLTKHGRSAVAVL